jgi:hypothetical protein
MPKHHDHKSVEYGSSNVFAELGFPNAEEHLVKAQLVYKIDTIMKKRRLKQVEAPRPTRRRFTCIEAPRKQTGG